MTDSAPAVRRSAAVAAAAVVALVALALAAPASAAEHDHSNSTAIAIPDGTTPTCWSLPPANPAVSTITVPHYGVVDDVTVTVDLSHTWHGDILIELESPQGTTRQLISRIGRDAHACGSSRDGIQATLDDAATTPAWQ